ncbi:MAG: ATP-binding protein [bacterium]
MKIRSFTQKIVISFLTVLLLIAALASVSYHAFIRMERLSEELNQMLLLDMFLDESMGFHRKWMNDLAQVFLLDRKFQGNLDPSKCEFGKWHRSFEPPDAEIAELHKGIEKPHRILHESAREILSLIYTPGLERELAHHLEDQKNAYLSWLLTLSKAIGNKDKNLLASCEKITYSFDQLYDGFAEGDEKGISGLQALEEFRRCLSSTTRQVFQLARQDRWKEADRIYRQDILPVNEKFLECFSALEKLIHQRIDGNRRAREIFASHTMPAMEDLQQLVDRIRIKLMGRIDKMEKEYTRVVRRSKTFIVWSIVLIFSLAVLYSILIPQSLTRPIKHLTQFANRIATEGDLSETIEISNRDEIGQLASSFNRMVQALRKSREELEEWGKTLEKKVESRTKDLKDAYQKLETANAHLIQSSKLASIGELAAGMAHEINNPMNIVIGYAELLLDEVTPDTESSTYIQGILEAGQRVSVIIKNLLIFARQGKQEYSSFSVHALIDHALSFVQRLLEKEGIRIERNYEHDLPLLYVRGSQLEQVFLNLIMNAKDALLDKAEKKGETFDKVLKIQARRVQENQVPMVRITFRDTGAGIKPENLNRVFDPFFTTKREDRGTGLGLSISYGIIKDHQGSIRVESREGEFTEFTVDLPVKDAPLRS